MARLENVIPVFPDLEERFGLSYAVKAGKTIYLSGLLAADDNFNLVGENDMEAQIRCIYGRLQFVLAKCDADLRHVVSEINFTTNSPALSRASWVREKIYQDAGAAMPAATGVGVSSLYLPGAMLETHATAVLD
ncbi:MAG: Rid family hydrolase [Rhodospirillaceae bacterium]|jgi:enamine deaminase RidA (YjgF/YER057c/UK114 family)